jgi:stringent starvation protein B
MTPPRPYLLRAFYEWITDNSFTPYLLVNAEMEGVIVPREHVKEGKIILNISPEAVHGLFISNDAVEFKALFSGASRSIYVPISAALAIYTKENGRGMVFSEEDLELEEGGEGGTSGAPSPKKGKPNLKIVK